MITPTPPERVALLPADPAGLPVPWFATEPGSRAYRAGPAAVRTAVRLHLCWACGVPLRRQEDRAFIVTPPESVTHLAAWPPAHRDCAVYAARVCPHLATAAITRRDDTTADVRTGIVLVWVTGYRNWRTVPQGKPPGAEGVLFDIGDPREVLWFSQGQPAEPEDILAAIQAATPEPAGEAP